MRTPKFTDRPQSPRGDRVLGRIRVTFAVAAGLALAVMTVGCAATVPHQPSPATSSQPTSAPAASTPIVPADGCPDAPRCSDYTVVGVGWQPDPRGDISIHYRINPSPPPGSALTPASVVAAVTAAAQTWMSSDPHLRLVYDGPTTEPPVVNNVVGFADDSASGSTQVDHGPGGYYHGHYEHFSVRLSNAVSWDWDPCDQALGHICTPYSRPGRAAATWDVQDVMTHEWGHVVGLEHATRAVDYELTMYGGGPYGPLCDGTKTCRFRDTLGLGDVLGVRSMYPTKSPLPRLLSRI